jgi:predicted nucleic acid-binding protein
VTFVLDASTTLAWSFLDERTPDTTAIVNLVATQGAIVPTHWRLEIANAFQRAIRRNRTDTQARDAALADLDDMEITVDLETDLHAWHATLKLADLYGLSIYDAAYLELAQRKRLPLATLDAELANAARRAGVDVLP